MCPRTKKWRTGGRKEGRLAGYRIRRIDKVTACVEKERKEKKRRLRMAILVQETVKERRRRDEDDHLHSEEGKREMKVLKDAGSE